LTLVTEIALRHTDNIGLAASNRVAQMTAGPIEMFRWKRPIQRRMEEE
jgi:hypothetical protein